MKLALVRACTRSACFELQNNTCYTAPAPFRVQLNGQIVLEACCTNVFSVFSLEPGKTYHLEVLATDGDTGTLDFATAAESFFVDASRYGLVNDGVTDNTAFLQAALSTCPPGRHGVCARRYLPHPEPVFVQQHHPVPGKRLHPAGRHRPPRISHPAWCAALRR